MPESPGAASFARLLRRLDIEQLDRDLFLGDSGRGHGRLFGGLVAAQSLVAASRTVAEGDVHSLHAYFLRPGQHNVPIRFVVDRIRDGRTFTTRRVVAHQEGEAIFSAEVSYTRSEDGIEHQRPMPEAPPPAGLPDWDAIRADRNVNIEERERSPIELKACDPDAARGLGEPRPFLQVWVRPKGPLPEDPVMHGALLTFASDRGMLSTVARMHGIPWNRTATASLDHAVWFHRPPRFDGWLLFTTESPAAYRGRALTQGTLHREDGTLVASVAQEGLVRAPR